MEDALVGLRQSVYVTTDVVDTMVMDLRRKTAALRSVIKLEQGYAINVVDAVT